MRCITGIGVASRSRGGAEAKIYVRQKDKGNYAVVIFDSSTVNVYGFTNGHPIFGSAGVAYTPAAPNAIKIKMSSTTIKVWVDTVLKLTRTISAEPGGVSFTGTSPTFDNVKIGYGEALRTRAARHR